MNLTNYHSHCLYCDGRADMAAFARFAAAKRFSAYGYSSHAPLPFPTAWTMEWDRMDDYLSEFRRLKEQYAGRMELCIGLEIDYLNEESHPASARFQDLPLDYRIGSIHLLRNEQGEVVDADLSADRYAQMIQKHFHGNLEQAVYQYYERANRMLELGGFDILGHADKMHHNAECYCPHVTEEDWYTRLVHTHLAEAVKRGYLIEINTKAFYELGVFYPDIRYFPYLHSLKARVVVNSDAHYPERINYGRLEALQALTHAGFTTVAELHGGTWQDVPIDVCPRQAL